MKPFSSYLPEAKNARLKLWRASRISDPPQKPESLLGIGNKDMFQVDRMRRSQVSSGN